MPLQIHSRVLICTTDKESLNNLASQQFFSRNVALEFQNEDPIRFMTEELISAQRVKIAVPSRVPTPALILISGQGL